MSEIKPGDYVTVHRDHIKVVNVDAGYEPTWLEVNDVVTGDEQIPIHWCTVEPPRFAVGDVLGPDSPEPPNGTVALSSTGVAWQRNDDDGDDIATGPWFLAGNEVGQTWGEVFARYANTPFTVLYVPEQEATQ